MNDDVERDEDDAPDTQPEPEPEPAPAPDAGEDESELDAPDDDESDEDADEDEAYAEEGQGGEDAEDAEDAEDDEDDDPGEVRSSEAPPAEGGARANFRDSDLFRQQRKRLETTLRDVIRKAVEKGVDAGVGAIEQSVDVIERSVEVGRGRVKSVRDVIEDVKIPKDLPKDIAGAIFSQIEEGKNVLVGAVASEVRGFLEDTDIAYELQRALTSLSFEISTEIRFVPNERGVPRAEVHSNARPKVSSRRARRRRRDEETDED
jgi:hypothetical protein